MRTVGRSETWHSDARDALARPAQLIECAHTYQQSQRGIQSTRDAHHHVLGIDVRQSLSQSCHLNGKDLLATLVQRWSLWHERMRVIATCQHRFTRNYLRHLHMRRHIGSIERMTGREGGIGTTLSTQILHIYLAHHQLWLQTKALITSQQPTVLINQSVASIHHVGTRLSKATGAIHIATDASSTLLTKQLAQVSILAYHLITGRKVEDDVSPMKRVIRARWDRCPDILTQFDAEGGSRRLEEDISP